MRKIRVKMYDLNVNDTCSFTYYIYKSLQKFYEVELSENPEYLFYFGPEHDHYRYNCIKIFYSGENICPNFNTCDYGVGFDYINFYDRYHRFPIYLANIFFHKDEHARGIDADFVSPAPFTMDDLKLKTEFCSFTYSNYLADETRNIFFRKLSEYKKVNSGGSYLNNIGGRVANKLEFEEKHKFVMAFENSSNIGYVTDRLPAALAARTIPIYWGNPQISKEFNEKRFVNCHSYSTIDDVVKRVVEIDNDDELYLKIINEPVTVPTYNFKNERRAFDDFLKYIIDQPVDAARRRKINPSWARNFDKYDLIIANFIRIREKTKRILAIIYRPFKKFNFLEEIKYKYFKSGLKNNIT